MRTPDDIERMLGERLIPRGFSERGARDIEAAIDELAAADPPSRRGRWIIAAAAALAAAATLAMWPSAPAPRGEPVAAASPAGEVELLSESVGVLSVEPDDALRSDAEGNLLRAWHVRVVSEERFRDAETGHEVRVVRPSDELVLLPVSTF